MNRTVSLWVTVFGLLLFLVMPSLAANEYDVKSFGAVGNGTTSDAKAIQKGIDSLTKAGGGTLQFKSGTFLAGQIYLKSNVTLQIDESATLKSNGDYSQLGTDTYKCMYNGESYMDRAFIFAQNADNIGLTGKGTIDGSGKSFADLQRPMMIRFVSCNNVTVKDLRLLNPAAYTSVFHYCKNVVVDGIDVSARAQPNGDGVDFDGCDNVKVMNSTFNTSDDAMCLQASKKEFPCKNIHITNCRTTVARGAALRIGLLSVGDFDSIEVDHCHFDGLKDAAFKIQECEGGKMSNMFFHDLELINSPRIAFMTLNSFRFSRLEVEAGRALPPIHATPFSNIRFNNILLNNPTLQDANSHLIIAGIPGHTIDNIEISGISFIAPGGGSAAQAAKRNLGELTDRRPEPSVLGVPPAYGVYMHHAKNITIRNSLFKTLGTDARSAIVGEDASKVQIISNRLTGGISCPGSIESTEKNIAQGATTKVDPNSYTVDLGARHTIDRVVLWWNANYGQDYKIQVATDTTQWSDAVNFQGGLGAINNLTFSPMSCRYVRMLGLQSGKTGYSLSDFEVYATQATAIGSPNLLSHVPRRGLSLQSRNRKLAGYALTGAKHAK